jgi:DNA-binding NarL/FixJ family response regulator
MASVPVESPVRRQRNQGPAFVSSPTRWPGPGVAGIDVLVAHPEPGRRAAIRHMLDGDNQVRVVAVAGDSEQAEAAAERLHPAVALVDDRLAGREHAERIARRSRLILLIGETEPRAVTAMLLGPARGYVTYGHLEPAELLGAVRAVAGGLAWLCPVAASAATAAMRASAEPAAAPGPVPPRWDHGLTEREREVLELLCRGMSNAAIATALALAEKTVKNHLSRSFAKLGVHNRVDAVRRLGVSSPR